MPPKKDEKQSSSDEEPKSSDKDQRDKEDKDQRDKEDKDQGDKEINSKKPENKSPNFKDLKKFFNEPTASTSAGSPVYPTRAQVKHLEQKRKDAEEAQRSFDLFKSSICEDLKRVIANEISKLGQCFQEQHSKSEDRVTKNTSDIKALQSKSMHFAPALTFSRPMVDIQIGHLNARFEEMKRMIDYLEGERVKNLDRIDKLEKSQQSQHRLLLMIAGAQTFAIFWMAIYVYKLYRKK